MRDRRKKLGMTQQQLAWMVGVNRATLAKYENGARVPSMRAAKALANALGCTLDELVAETEEQKHV